MKHVQNIARLFGSGSMENPLLQTISAGEIHLPTGRLITCDPLITNDRPNFSVKFPAGNFPVRVHKEKESNCIAYVEIIFSQNPAVRWEMATCEDQDETTLEEGEVYGYPAESGMGAFMDRETQDCLNHLEKKLFHSKGADFMGIYEEFFHEHFFDENGAIDQYAFLKPDEEKAGTIFAFETGYGEGFYASYIGFDAEDQPIKIVTEFIEVEN